jgi:hypothetical protein
MPTVSAKLCILGRNSLIFCISNVNQQFFIRRKAFTCATRTVPVAMETGRARLPLSSHYAYTSIPAQFDVWRCILYFSVFPVLLWARDVDVKRLQGWPNAPDNLARPERFTQ